MDKIILVDSIEYKVDGDSVKMIDPNIYNIFYALDKSSKHLSQLAKYYKDNFGEFSFIKIVMGKRYVKIDLDGNLIKEFKDKEAVKKSAADINNYNKLIGELKGILNKSPKTSEDFKNLSNVSENISKEIKSIEEEVKKDDIKISSSTVKTEEKPVEEKPVEEKPVEEKPVEEKPVEEKPVEEKPVEENNEKLNDETISILIDIVNELKKNILPSINAEPEYGGEKEIKKSSFDKDNKSTVNTGDSDVSNLNKNIDWEKQEELFKGLPGKGKRPLIEKISDIKVGARVNIKNENGETLFDEPGLVVGVDGDNVLVDIGENSPMLFSTAEVVLENNYEDIDVSNLFSKVAVNEIYTVKPIGGLVGDISYSSLEENDRKILKGFEVSVEKIEEDFI